jgi:predicted ATPase
MLTSVNIPHVNGQQLSVPIACGKPTFVVGRNGSGKSALMNYLRNQLPDSVVYLPGSRPSYFDADSLSLTAKSRRDLSIQINSRDRGPDARYRSLTGTRRNEKAIYDLQNAELQFKVDAANEIAHKQFEGKAIARLQSQSSPLDRVNALLIQAALPIRTRIESAELLAERGPSVYSIAHMSDGERTALIFAAEVIAADAGSIFLVDEPELHLHPAIVLPLISALVLERPDCGFIISTHELGLPGEHTTSPVVVVNESQWAGERVMAWDAYVLLETTNIPESLRVDLLGARKKVLFIEGQNTASSLDHPLYALLYPAVSVIPKGSCGEVDAAVEGLLGLMQIHHTQAFGLIDHDGMTPEQLAAFETKGVFPLPFFAVESIYYCDEMLSAVAAQQASTLGEDPSNLLAQAKALALQSLKSQNLEHLASRLSERHIRDKLLAQLPSRNSLKTAAPINFQFESPYPNELNKITEFQRNGTLDAIIERYPVRETEVLDKLAKGLRFQGRTDYERAALARVACMPELQVKLKAKLGKLSDLLT